MYADSRQAARPHQHADTGQDSRASSPQSQAQSVAYSQTSHITSTTDQADTQPGSDSSRGVDGPSVADVTAMLKQRYAASRAPERSPGHESQLHQLSAIAAVQDRMEPDQAGPSLKRMADGEIKAYHESPSPVKGHSRNVSAISTASTAGSTIAELSAELRTRLSYAMIKVNHGWQARSIDDVESLLSQSASSTSSPHTTHPGNGLSASPMLPPNAPPSQVHFATESVASRRDSNTSPSASARFPGLAPPALIQPDTHTPPTLKSSPRRDSNPRYTAATLSHRKSSTSPRPQQSPFSPPTQFTPVSNGQSSGRNKTGNDLYSPQKNVREQDAIESLLFMSSPKNSANLGHNFSPAYWPRSEISSVSPSKTPRQRRALPSEPRKPLPSGRSPTMRRTAGIEKSPPGAPTQLLMDADSPQQPHHRLNKAASTRRHAPSNHKSSLSLPSGLGLGSGTSRKTLRDEDIERMLDRADSKLSDSSDDEELRSDASPHALSQAWGLG